MSFGAPELKSPPTCFRPDSVKDEPNISVFCFINSVSHVVAASVLYKLKTFSDRNSRVRRELS